MGVSNKLATVAAAGVLATGMLMEPVSVAAGSVMPNHEVAVSGVTQMDRPIYLEPNGNWGEFVGEPDVVDEVIRENPGVRVILPQDPEWAMIVGRQPGQIDPMWQNAQISSNIGSNSVVPQQVNQASINAVRLSEIPQFQNNNQFNTTQTNRLVADVIGRRIDLLHTMNIPQGMYSVHNQPSPELIAWYAETMRQIMEVWDQDPISGLFGVNREGMMMQVDQALMMPFMRSGNDWYGVFTGFNREGGFALNVERESAIHIFIYELFGRGEGFCVPLNNLLAELMRGADLSDGGPMLEFFDQIGGIVGFDTIFAWARQGDEVVRSELIRVARLHNISVPAGVQDVLVNDHVMAYFDISMPEAGVRSRSFFESVAGMTFVETMIALESMNMIRPHIFPEIEAGHIFGMTQSGSMMVEGNWPDFDVWTGSMPQAGVSGQEEAVRVQ